MAAATQLQLKQFNFTGESPHLPAELVRELYAGKFLISIDEKLYYHLKFVFRRNLFFESDEGFAIELSHKFKKFVVECFVDGEDYFLKPAELMEH